MFHESAISIPGKSSRIHFTSISELVLQWFRVQGSGFRVQGSGFRVQGSGFRVQDLTLFYSDVGLTSALVPSLLISNLLSDLGLEP